MLGFFKYEAFLASNLNVLLGSNVIPALELALPVGISFYTLQALSYVVDVYRGDVPAQRNPAYLGMYIAMFPQLVAGPIVRYADIEDQILHRQESMRKVAAGLRLFVVGLAKKALLANVVARLSASMMSLGGPQIGAVGAWAGLVAYTFQILFDFSGYSDMAIGLGRMLGFDFPRNFYYPYVATSVTDFWRRWHISLSSFFRDYVYIPLGGNRVARARWVRNLAAVWVLTGVWHGAAWNYVLWGVYYLVLLLLEKLVWGKALGRAPALFRHAYAVFAFMFGWLLFWCEDLSLMPAYLAAMFGRYGATGSSTMWELGAWEYWPALVACAVASTPVVPRLRDAIVRFRGGQPLPEDPRSTAALCDYEAAWDGPMASVGLQTRPDAICRLVRLVPTLADAALLALLLLSLAAIVSGSFNPFIYFRF